MSSLRMWKHAVFRPSHSIRTVFSRCRSWVRYCGLPRSSSCLYTGACTFDDDSFTSSPLQARHHLCRASELSHRTYHCSWHPSRHYQNGHSWTSSTGGHGGRIAVSRALVQLLQISYSCRNLSPESMPCRPAHDVLHQWLRFVSGQRYVPARYCGRA